MRQHRLWLGVVAIAFSVVVFGTSAFTQGQKAGPAAGSALTCDMQRYKALTGLRRYAGQFAHGDWAGSDGSTFALVRHRQWPAGCAISLFATRAVSGLSWRKPDASIRRCQWRRAIFESAGEPLEARVC
jgi:hypothetical protein